MNSSKIDNTQLNNWLYELVEEYPSRRYYGKYDKSFYYPTYKIENDCNPEPRGGTRFYEANNIFKELVDHCFKYGIIDELGHPVISVANKKSFMQYVYDHSEH